MRVRMKESAKEEKLRHILNGRKTVVTLRDK